MSKLPIIEVFTSIQGEGVYMGVPSVFVRVSGCNLRCVFKNSICDTPYSSFAPEKTKFTIEDVVNEFKNHPQVRHLVLTGGEPTLYNISEFLNDLESMLKEIDISFPIITIETNGSLKTNTDNRISLWSISPKLSTSCAPQEVLEENPNNIVHLTFGNTEVEIPVKTLQKHAKERINIDQLAQFIVDNFDSAFSDIQLKFVWSGNETEVEINELLQNLADNIQKIQESSNGYILTDPLQYLNGLVYIMPEGETESKMTLNAQDAANACIRNGWNYTDRLHIRIWGSQRNK